MKTHLKIWLTVSLISLSALMLFTAWMSQKPFCVDSRSVTQLDRIGLKEGATVFQCSAKKYVPYDDKIALRTDSLNRNIARIETVANWTGLRLPHISVTVIEKKPYLFQVYNDRFFLGVEYWLRPGYFERALMKSIIRANASEEIRTNPFYEEILVDVFLNLALSDNSAQSYSKRAMAHKLWPQILSNGASYCASEFRRFEDLDDCNASIGLENLSAWPFVSYHLIEAIKSLSLQKRMQLIPKVAKLITRPVKHQIYRSEIENPYLSLKKQVQYIYDLLGDTELQTRFDLSMRASGFDLHKPWLEFDDVIQIDSDDNIISTHKESIDRLISQSKNKKIAIVTKSSVFVLPELEPLTHKDLGRIISGKTIYERCGTSSIEDLRSFDGLTDRVLVINNCKQDSKIDYASYFNGGIEPFAAANKTVSFIQIHVPSLSLLHMNEVENLNVFGLVQKTNWDSKVFKALGWKSPQWISTAEAYRVDSAIEAIDWFRVQQNPVTQ